MPLALTDDELAIVVTAAAPIHPRDRGAFLADVAAELARYPEIGVGVIHRVTARLQHAHLGPRTGHNVGSKYGH